MMQKKSPGSRKNQERPPNEDGKTNLVDLVDENLENIVAYQLRTEQDLDQHRRVIEMLTKNVGRPRFLYMMVLVVVLWIAAQKLLAVFGMAGFDPSPFNWLQGLIGLSSLVVTTMVLITQNRQAKQAEQRRHLDLQVTLLVEQKVTKVIALLEELRRDLPSVQDRVDTKAEAMQEVVNPQEVLQSLEEMLGDYQISPTQPG